MVVHKNKWLNLLESHHVLIKDMNQVNENQILRRWYKSQIFLKSHWMI